MKLTRDIVKDLLPVYLAGDASPATRTLVEEWVAGDPELARQIEAARRLDLPPVGPAERSMEMRALAATKRRLRRKSILFGVAIYATTLPVTVTFNRHGFQGLLIEDWSERIVVAAIAVALWVIYARVSRSLRVSGL